MGFISRNIKAAVKLPVAMAWDVISLGNMGDGTSTSKVIRKHGQEKAMDDLVETVDKIKRLIG